MGKVASAWNGFCRFYDSETRARPMTVCQQTFFLILILSLGRCNDVNIVLVTWYIVNVTLTILNCKISHKYSELWSSKEITCLDRPNNSMNCNFLGPSIISPQFLAKIPQNPRISSSTSQLRSLKKSVKRREEIFLNIGKLKIIRTRERRIQYLGNVRDNVQRLSGTVRFHRWSSFATLALTFSRVICDVSDDYIKRVCPCPLWNDRLVSRFLAADYRDRTPLNGFFSEQPRGRLSGRVSSARMCVSRRFTQRVATVFELG